MREWEELPDEESIKRMNAEYRRISVLQGAAQGAESTGGKAEPREQSAQEKATQDAQTAGECLSALRAVRACAQTMREKSARARGERQITPPAKGRWKRRRRGRFSLWTGLPGVIRARKERRCGRWRSAFFAPGCERANFFA